MIASETIPSDSTKILGFDTATKLSAAAARALTAAGLSFAFRYVNLTRGTTSETLDGAELVALTDAGLGVMAVQFARTGGWSETTGRVDGAAAASNAVAAGLPADVTLACDMEGAFASAAQATDYGSGWFEGARRGGAADLMLYVGAGVPLSEQDLYRKLPFTKYWRSFSNVPNVAVRGYTVLQLGPSSQRVADVLVDLDVIQSDFLGGRPRWAHAS